MAIIDINWTRILRTPFIGYHHVLMFISMGAIILMSILLAGCTTSDNLGNVYLLSLRYTNSSQPMTNSAQVSTAIQSAVYNISQAGSGSTLEVRAGYMGLCISQDNEGRVCSSNAKVLANILKAERSTSTTGNLTTETTPDPLNLILIAEEFRTKIVFDGLLYISVVLTFACFLLLSTFPGWHQEVDDSGSEVEVKPFPSRAVSQAALGIISLSFGFAFISVLWQHINSSSTASMAETLTYGAVSGHVGTAGMILGWFAVALIGGVSLGLLIMILSISIIDRLTDSSSVASSYLVDD
ncbi:Ca2+ regulator and membrane fusion protein Fig1-domain-containing protein [Penicillium odoratum]|uniref:Ca2+ regulator and membrane fusion protein Fig1-domain-containing protein n=1 Tax=Penicillium odoratum TaxID=1167516 RepID=UPI002547B7BB|nr:Ca2+ regulator and membrane fusion protein Fig1-domain-containing protein [Penicillium odoratum]KAJ5772425.1 Ca2+ regulator and membrane fusion protein Fig1-domain-containing protein [Penicillium odoratum]